MFLIDNKLFTNYMFLIIQNSKLANTLKLMIIEKIRVIRLIR